MVNNKSSNMLLHLLATVRAMQLMVKDRFSKLPTNSKLEPMWSCPKLMPCSLNSMAMDMLNRFTDDESYLLRDHSLCSPFLWLYSCMFFKNKTS